MANPSEPPAHATAGDPQQPDEVAAIAARIGIELPMECVAGVRHHIELLDRHWAGLRASARPPA